MRHNWRRIAVLAICVNAIGLIAFLRLRADKLLGAAVDPLHPDWVDMQRAFAGFATYAVSLLALCAIAALFGLSWLRRRLLPAADSPLKRAAEAGRAVALATALTAGLVLVFIEVLLFQDYGIHLYEFDVFGILADSALRRDLGIQPAEVIRVTVAALLLILAQLLLIAGAWKLSGWQNGALARASGTALLVAAPAGLMLFSAGEQGIAADRADFESALPLGRQLLLRDATRPFIRVAPRVGDGGYPTLAPTDVAPTMRRSNIVFFVADGLRGDMFGSELTPNLARFAERPEVIRSQRHFSSGHVSEAGVFGLLYGVNGQAFHSFMEARVPPYPIEVLRRNGYHTLLIASSRLSPYPSDQLIRAFDEVVYPANDDAAVDVMRRYVAERAADGRPYFIFGFFYTPHYPFTSAKPQFRKYPMVGPKARTNYMNDVLQVDDYFRQVFEIVRGDYERGRTIVLATSDHGEEIRDHGVFGHASATFWNEKIVVPMLLALPEARLTGQQRAPALTSHADVWPTILDHLVSDSVGVPAFSDGQSLLRAPSSPPQALVTGRFFPHADRPSVLVDAGHKYWFRVDGLGANGRLCVVVTRVTDLDDNAVGEGASNAAMIAAFERLQANFWRFIQSTGPSAPPGAGKERRIC